MDLKVVYIDFSLVGICVVGVCQGPLRQGWSDLFEPEVEFVRRPASSDSLPARLPARQGHPNY